MTLLKGVAKYMQKTGCKHLQRKNGVHKHLLLTECLKFSRVEVIQETEKPLLHLLHVWDIGEKGVLNRSRLRTFSFSALRFRLLFHHSANKMQFKNQLHLTAFKKRWLCSDCSRLSKICELNGISLKNKKSEQIQY